MSWMRRSFVAAVALCAGTAWFGRRLPRAPAGDDEPGSSG